MKGKIHYLLPALLALVLFSAPHSFAVDQEPESPGELNKTKVVRIRSLEGEVLVKTAADAEWIQAHEYMILTEKYRVSTGPGGFVEDELDPAQFIRLRENSEISIFDLNSHTAVFRYISGGVYVSALESRMRGIEFDLGPMRSSVFFGQGAFRIDEDGYGGTEVTVREGILTVEHESGKVDIREGQMASVNAGVVVGAARGKDSWDDFVQKRDNDVLALASRPQIYEEIPGRYETYGYSEWVAYPAYGYFWWPHVSLVFIGSYGHHHGHYYYGPYYGHRHKHHLHSGVSIGIYGGHYKYKRYGHYGKHRYYKKHRYYRKDSYYKKHRHRGRHRYGGKDHDRYRYKSYGTHKTRIFHRGESRYNGAIKHRSNGKGGHSFRGGHVKKWGGGNRGRSFSRGGDFRGRSFRGGGGFRSGGGRSVRMGGGGFRGGGGRR